MGRGLSQLQRAVLEVLAAFPQPEPRGDRLSLAQCARPRDLLDALAMPRTPQSYATLSKSLARLARRGLIVAYAADLRLPGNGYRYALPPG